MIHARLHEECLVASRDAIAENLPQVPSSLEQELFLEISIGGVCNCLEAHYKQRMVASVCFSSLSFLLFSSPSSFLPFFPSSFSLPLFFPSSFLFPSMLPSLLPSPLPSLFFPSFPSLPPPLATGWCFQSEALCLRDAVELELAAVHDPQTTPGHYP